MWTRLGRELRCIRELGSALYFLLAHEAAGIARSRGVPVTGRGSAANSLVAYCLGLIQPRALPEQAALRAVHARGARRPAGHRPRPVFEAKGRGEGRGDPAPQPVRCGCGGDGRHPFAAGRREGGGAGPRAPPRGEIETSSRATSPPASPTAASRTTPSLAGRRRSGSRRCGATPWQDTEKHRLLLELSGRLRGKVWQPGTHLGGLVFGNEKNHLSELVPLEPSGKDGLLRTQYDKDDLEYAGLPKLDLLGLRMHTALHEAGELASGRLGRKVDPYAPPPGDRETYRPIGTGRNVGMFQSRAPGR